MLARTTCLGPIYSAWRTQYILFSFKLQNILSSHTESNWYLFSSKSSLIIQEIFYIECGPLGFELVKNNLGARWWTAWDRGRLPQSQYPASRWSGAKVQDHDPTTLLHCITLFLDLVAIFKAWLDFKCAPTP